jgi:hypothetical protein
MGDDMSCFEVIMITKFVFGSNGILLFGGKVIKGWRSKISTNILRELR